MTVAPVFRRGEPVRKSFPKSGDTPDGPHIASHPKGSVVAFYTTSGTYLWDYGRGDAPTRIAAALVGPLAFSPDGLRLWGVASNGCIDSWPLLPAIRATHWVDTSGTLSGLLENHRLPMLEAVRRSRPRGSAGLSGLTADARWVLAAGKDGGPGYSMPRTGSSGRCGTTASTTCSVPGSTQHSVALSPDGILGASGMQSGRIWLRRVPGGEEVASLEKHQGAVDALAFQPDGRLLASGSRDGTIRLWRSVGKVWSEVLTLRHGRPGPPPQVQSRRHQAGPPVPQRDGRPHLGPRLLAHPTHGDAGLDWDEDERPGPEGGKQ